MYFGDVEHVKPKSLFPAEQLDPENLVLACVNCNNAKGEFWELLRSELCHQAGADGEYAIVVRAYLEAACDLRCVEGN